MRTLVNSEDRVGGKNVPVASALTRWSLKNDTLGLMARKAWKLAGAAWLIATAIQAPFAHFHPADPQHRHARGLGHLHLGAPTHHESSSGPTIEEHHDEESAVWMQWAPVAPQRVIAAFAGISTVLAWRPVLAISGRAAECTPRSHDPPSRRFRPARSPPL